MSKYNLYAEIYNSNSNSNSKLGINLKRYFQNNEFDIKFMMFSYLEITKACNNGEALLLKKTLR